MNFDRRLAFDRRGFTMVEMMISIAVLSILVAVSMSLLITSTTEFSAETTVVTLEAEARRALEKITEDVRQGQLNTMTGQVPLGPASVSVIAFTKATGMSQMAPVFGPTITYQYQWNAAKNWGEVTRNESGKTILWVSKVQANGFSVFRDPMLTNKVTIRLTLESPGPYNAMIARTVETSVYPRN